MIQGCLCAVIVLLLVANVVAFARDRRRAAKERQLTLSIQNLNEKGMALTRDYETITGRYQERGKVLDEHIKALQACREENATLKEQIRNMRRKFNDSQAKVKELKTLQPK